MLEDIEGTATRDAAHDPPTRDAAHDPKARCLL
jgi:hypothetical protein